MVILCSYCTKQKWSRSKYGYVVFTRSKNDLGESMVMLCSHEAKIISVKVWLCCVHTKQKLSRWKYGYVVFTRSKYYLGQSTVMLCSHKAKIISVTEISPVSRRDLGRRKTFRRVFRSLHFN
jgi:hypothetical protein